MFSIVIPTKDEAKTLPALLASVQRQTLPPVEVIVADANSTDETVPIAQAFGAKVVAGGLPGVGRNRGAAIARGTFLLFLDADVILEDPEFLQKAAVELRSRQLDFATCDTKPLSTRFDDRIGHAFYNRYMRLVAHLHPVAPGFCIFSRRSSHEKMRGFDESVLFCEDHEYVMRAGRIGKFGILNTIKISVSVRRLDRDGRLVTAIKYILAELHTWLLGPIRDNRFHYTFGHK